jgi:hypothetical protein
MPCLTTSLGAISTNDTRSRGVAAYPRPSRAPAAPAETITRRALSGYAGRADVPGARGFAGAHQRPDRPGSQRSGGHQPDDEHGEHNRMLTGRPSCRKFKHPTAVAASTYRVGTVATEETSREPKSTTSSVANRQPNSARGIGNRPTPSRNRPDAGTGRLRCRRSKIHLGDRLPDTAN